MLYYLHTSKNKILFFHEGNKKLIFLRVGIAMSRALIQNV